MAGSNINRVIITGNLTRDPELSSREGSFSICSLRIACNGRRKNGQTGNWEEVANYFDVTVFGAQGENCAKYLSKGRGVAVDGRLRWREWDDKETGKKRQGVDIVAESVQFLSSGDGPSNGNGNGSAGFSSRAQQSDVAIDTHDFETASVGAGSDDDIPF